MYLLTRIELFQILKQYKIEALKMLDVIKGGYSTFEETIIRESKKLPSSLEPDLKFYDSSLCHHLQVARQEMKPSQSVCSLFRLATPQETL